MTRVEENEAVVNDMYKRSESTPAVTYEEVVTFQLGAVAIVLADISKSLAALADKSKPETVTEFADRCRECGAKYGKLLKTGHWIPLGNYDDYGNESSYKCSECGDLDTYPDNFCPNCGAKMQEVQDEDND